MPEAGAPPAPDAAAGAAGARGGTTSSRRPPGLLAQGRTTKDAFSRLISAHLDLARAEFAVTLREDAKFAGLLFAALALLFLAALTITIGFFLFFGEAVFGSLGWGALHGMLLLIAVAVSSVLVALGMTGGTVAIMAVVAALIGVLVGVILGTSFTNYLWLQLTDAVNLPVAEEWQVLVTVVLFSAIAGAVIGALAWARQETRSGFFTWLIGGAAVAVLFGLFTAIPFSAQVGAAIGVTAWLILWPTMLGLLVQARGIDTDALQRRLLPMETVDQAKETMTWLQERAGRVRRPPAQP